MKIELGTIRVEVYHHFADGNILRDISRKLDAILKREEILMGAYEDILQAVTDQTTVGDSLVLLLESLLAESNISPAQVTEIVGKLKAKQDEWAAAIVANTPAAPVE